MPCANCGKSFEEHRDGLAYRDLTGAGAECGGYVGIDVGHEPSRTVYHDSKGNFVCRICGAPTKFYERPDLCLKCETKKQ